MTHSIGRGVSQSGNFLRGWLHLGFNRDEAQRQVHDGLWPIIAGRRIALNFRWAQPDGVLELYQAGSEGPQWWLPHPDPVRGGGAAGLLDRCTATNTCPKIVEHLGAAEVWAQDYLKILGICSDPLEPALLNAVLLVEAKRDTFVKVASSAKNPAHRSFRSSRPTAFAWQTAFGMGLRFKV